MREREIPQLIAHVERLGDKLSATLRRQGYEVNLSCWNDKPGCIVWVWTRGMPVAEFVILHKSTRWYWYRAIPDNKIRNRDHLLALSRASATTLVWARKNKVAWTDRDVFGKDVRPLGEVQ